MADPAAASPATYQTLERVGSEAAASLPALLTEAERVAGALAAGAHGRRRAGSGETFWQYRDYAFGDAASSVDWRQSARSPGRLYVRQTEWETSASIALWVSGGDSMDYASGTVTKRWRAQVIAAGLSSLLVRGGERVGPMDGPSRQGRNGLARLAEALLGDTAIDMPPVPPDSANRAVYISDFHVELTALLDRLAEIRAAGRPVHIVQVSDPAEISFPFGGRTVFVSPSGTDRLEKSDAAAIAAAYTAARAAHIDAIADRCAQYGWTFIRHVTDKPATPALASLHAAMAQDSALSGRGR